jgi:hypothetical protein
MQLTYNVILLLLFIPFPFWVGKDTTHTITYHITFDMHALTRIRKNLQEADEKNSKQCYKKIWRLFRYQNISKKRDIRNKYREHNQERKWHAESMLSLRIGGTIGKQREQLCGRIPNKQKPTCKVRLSSEMQFLKRFQVLSHYWPLQKHNS